MSRAGPDRAWSARGALLLGFAALGILVGGLGSWATATRIAGAIVASGRVEVQHSRQVVQHPDGGVVAEILATEGAVVSAGQPLLRLDGALLQSELAIVEGQFFEILARRGRLEAERDAAALPRFPVELIDAAASRTELEALMADQRRLLATREATAERMLAQLDLRTAQIESRIAGIEGQAAAVDEQLVLLREELATQQGLLRQGLAQVPRILALRREEARLQGERAALAAERARAAEALTEIDLERLGRQGDRREAAEVELRDLAMRELELAERRRALQERIARLEIRAPVAGIVHALAVTTPRAVLRPAEEVLQIVPQNRPLIIAARIATTDIDQLRPGQEARVMLSAFGARSVPQVPGRVVLVSADAFTDDSGLESHYRVEIELDPQGLARLDGRQIIPGMPAEVFLATGTRTPLSYLVGPLATYFDRAFRED